MSTWSQFRMDASRHVSRKAGQSAIAAAAYRTGERLFDVRGEETHDYTRRYGVLTTGLILPDGAPAWSREELWNAAEGAEKRKDARIARKIEMALPADATDAQRHELVRAWASELVSRYGVAVDYAIHLPDREGSERNHHVHLMMTTRKVTREGLSEKAELELSNTDQKKRGFAVGDDGIYALRVAMTEVFNVFAERHELDLAADPRSYQDRGIDIEPTVHVGVHATNMDRKGTEAERADQHRETRETNLRAIEARPELVFELLTQKEAVFTRRDIARELNRYVDDAEQFHSLLARLEASPDLVQLEAAWGHRLAQYSTRDMVAIEAGMIAAANELARAREHRVRATSVDAALARHTRLSDEQARAVRHVTGEERIAAVAGTAGAGKSASLLAAREAWEAEGYRVFGAALAGKAADELTQSAGIKSRTLHAYEHSWKKGRDQLGRGDVLVIDEAGMVGARQMARVLEDARKAGAKVVLVGDEAQLQPIEAGAPFRGVVQEIGVSVIETVRRQRHEWARGASQEFARGQIEAGLALYAERGHVRLLESRDEAKRAIARDSVMDARQGGSALILAHTNQDVRELNELVRAERQRFGEIDAGAAFQTEKGGRQFSVGDRLVFLRNDRTLDVKNGTLGTVERAADGRLEVRLDTGRTVRIDQAVYADVDHGYALTVHKSQGATVDRSYVLASGGMDRNLAYVAMTRHRDTATLYGGQDDFETQHDMGRRLQRARVKTSTLDYAERRGFETEKAWLENARSFVERGRARLEAAWARTTRVIDSLRDRMGPVPASSGSSEPHQPTRDRADELREAFAKKPAESAQERAAKLREMFAPGREIPAPETSKEPPEKRRGRDGPDFER